jgi:integrase
MFAIYLKRKGLTDRTIGQHCRRLEKILPYSHETFITFSSTLSPTSFNKYVQTAKHYCDFKKIEYEKDFFRAMPAPSKTRVTLTDEEIIKFLSISNRFDAFWYILAYHGCRPGEVLRLRVRDITEESIYIEKSKTGTGRVIALSSLAKKVVLEYVGRCEDKLFDFSDTIFYRDFKERLKKIGIKKHATPYSFRHSFATRLLTRTDAQLFAVQDILGHSDPNTTRTYYRNNLDAQARALNQDTILESKNPKLALQKDWEKLRNKLIKLQVSYDKISNLELTLWGCVDKAA